MLIRRADVNDYSGIKKIRDPFLLTPNILGREESVQKFSEHGFLLEEYSEEVFLKDLNKIFIVAKSDSKILGYVRVDNKVCEDFKSFDEAGKVVWLDQSPAKASGQDFKKKYYQNPHYEIGAILVDSKIHRTGVGRALLDYAFAAIVAEIPKIQNIVTIFSFVMVEPIKNQASLEFHKKNGFIQIAELGPCDLFGFEDYKSVLMAKTIEKNKKWD